MNSYTIQIFQILLTIWTSLFLSCSKSIYVYSDKFGTSKFVVYKDNYKYIEKSVNTDFKMWGKYYITDSTIVFEVKDKEKIPYHYFTNTIPKYSKNTNLQFHTITLIHSVSKEPIPLVSVKAKNNSGECVAFAMSNMEGRAEINKNDKIEMIELELPDFEKQRIDYKLVQDYDLIIELEQFKYGGRLSESCLSVFIDVLLEYQIPKKSAYDKFERSGIVFERQRGKSKKFNH